MAEITCSILRAIRGDYSTKPLELGGFDAKNIRKMNMNSATRDLLTRSFGLRALLLGRPRIRTIHSSPKDLAFWFGQLDKFQAETPAWAENIWLAGFECMIE